jgi:predicted ATP-dependent serine protease
MAYKCESCGTVEPTEENKCPNCSGDVSEIEETASEETTEQDTENTEEKTEGGDAE